MKNKTATLLIVMLCAFAAVRAQVATGGNYSLDQSVIAGGGGQNTMGGTFSVDGTIGQAIAGTNSTNPPFAVKSGFWTAASLAPTAASVTVSGKVLTSGGNGLTNARVILTALSGEDRTVTTSSFGYFRFDDVEVGQIYTITVSSRRYNFVPQVIMVDDEINDLNFTAF